MLRPATPGRRPAQAARLFDDAAGAISGVCDLALHHDGAKADSRARHPIRTTGVTLRLLSTSAAARARTRVAGEGRARLSTSTRSMMRDAPYRSLTLAVVEVNIPGGHSPGYLVILNQPLPTTPFVWRDDPAAFDDFPDFFIAHELAHQWWGQAVGWKNYHEQWLSEGIAQYFAALYAEHQRGPQVFGGCSASSRSGPWRVRPGPGLSGIPARSRQGRRADLPCAGLQQGRAPCCTCCGACSATTCSSRRSGASTPITGSRRRAPTDLRTCVRTGIGPLARGLLRPLDHGPGPADAVGVAHGVIRTARP